MQILYNRFRTHKELFFALIISFFSYFSFFGKLLHSDNVFWGSDIKFKFHPVRVYLYESLINEQRFPFWTEKIFSGFPIYADIENAYLHIVNILFTVFFGPVLSYKLLHLLSYLVGSVFLYKFLKNKGIGLAGYFIANLTFYFSYFFLNHQIHQSMVMTLYIFPVSLYLADKFFKTGRFRFILFNAGSLAYAFYWGHPQAMALYLIGVGIYLFAQYGSFLHFRELLKYITLTGWFFFILILPQLLPSLVLNAQSIRSPEHESISANTGALSAPLFLTAVYPTLFYDFDHFAGEDIDSTHSFVETYIYLGIVAVLLAIVRLTMIPQDRLSNYATALIVCFILISSARYTLFLDLDRVPVFSLFRYWNRAIVLGAFGVALLAGQFTENFSRVSFRLNKKTTLTLLIFVFYLVFLTILNISEGEIQNIMRNFLFPIYREMSFGWWRNFNILTLGLLAVVLYFKPKGIHKYVFQALIMLLVFLDLTYFSRHILQARIENISNPERVEISEELFNKRVIVEKGSIENNESLYYDVWWPFGYSQFITKNYYRFFEEAEIKKISRPEEEFLVTHYYDSYRALGVYAIEYDRNIEYIQETNTLDLLKTDLPGDYIAKQEGYIEMVLNLNEDQKVETYIKNYPGWKAEVNGETVSDLGDNLFITIDLASGENHIVLKYEPVHLYLGFFISALLLSLSSSVYFVKRFRKKRLPVKV